MAFEAQKRAPTLKEHPDPNEIKMFRWDNNIQPTPKRRRTDFEPAWGRVSIPIAGTVWMVLALLTLSGLVSLDDWARHLGLYDLLRNVHAIYR